MFERNHYKVTYSTHSGDTGAASAAEAVERCAEMLLRMPLASPIVGEEGGSAEAMCGVSKIVAFPNEDGSYRVVASLPSVIVEAASAKQALKKEARSMGRRILTMWPAVGYAIATLDVGELSAYPCSNY
jgi:hypothetical protein